MSGLPFEEIGDQGETQCLALFRVELGAGLVAARNSRGHRTAIIGHGDNVFLVLAAN
jgi:hypothetical protein